jgi:hypothetical protein
MTPRRAPSVISRSSISSQSSGYHPAPVVECPTFGSHAVFANKSLQSLASIPLPPNIKSLNAEKNQIVDFVGFIPSRHLETLKLANNPIASLRGIPPLPKLASIDMSGTPYSKHQFYRVSLLILFGTSLRLIDGERISGTERQLAKSYPAGTDALIRAGWVVSYPPPSPADLPKITASLAGRVTQNRPRVAPARTVPMIVRRPKTQSKIMDETLKQQELELAKLEEDIRKVRASRAKAPQK